MKAMKAIYGVVSLIIVMPIWYYLLYKLLESTQATQLEWFLFWVYVPVGLLMASLQKIIESAHD